MNHHKQAFTLIELLVVVLIISILAAVAVPQYQAAVLKSRFMAFMPLLRSLKEAQERYYMENGEYAVPLHNLDIQIPSHCKKSKAGNHMWFCGDEWIIDNRIGNNKPYGQLMVVFCPGNTDLDNYRTCRNNAIARIIFYYNNSTNKEKAGKIICEGDTSIGEKMCKTFLNN